MVGRLRMPSLDGATEWLDSEPLGPAELHGKVVLVNFWTFTCINWLRQEPYVRAWSDAYRDDGLIVIGVHTPEFDFEYDVEAVRRAVVARTIHYPVVIDNQYAIWQAFFNRYWPALYFVDRDGVIRGERFGEGHYEQSERLLQQLLSVDRELVDARGVGIEAAADWEQLGTPETYLGFGRSSTFASMIDTQSGDFEVPGTLRLHHWALAGRWDVADDKAILANGRGRIVWRFQARDAHLVMRRCLDKPIPFRLLLDGQPPGSAHGEDVDEDGHGVLDDGRLYQLVRTRHGSEHTIDLSFLAPGVEAYSFTFG